MSRMAGEIPPVDLSAALKSVGGNEELLGELVKIFLEELPRRLDAVRHAVSRGDTEESRRIAHSLKRSEEHTSELQSLAYLVCRLLLEKKKKKKRKQIIRRKQ